MHPSFRDFILSKISFLSRLSSLLTSDGLTKKVNSLELGKCSSQKDTRTLFIFSVYFSDSALYSRKCSLIFWSNSFISGRVKAVFIADHQSTRFSSYSSNSL